jgi:hypothetical protein
MHQARKDACNARTHRVCLPGFIFPKRLRAIKAGPFVDIPDAQEPTSQLETKTYQTLLTTPLL